MKMYFSYLDIVLFNPNTLEYSFNIIAIHDFSQPVNFIKMHSNDPSYNQQIIEFFLGDNFKNMQNLWKTFFACLFFQTMQT